ncbi:MAG TPA: Ig-like domain-containing protein, partial [Zoogloea sp.]|nr:Ig-like domain-containing protein [Zoogloea sp.]
GGSATSTVTIDVNPVNDAPVAVNDSASTSEDSPVSRTAALGVLANDSDVDSNILSVSGVRVGTSGAFAAPGAAGITLTGTYGSLLIRADGSYTYTPGAAAQALNTGDSVQDVFSYQLSDGSLTAVANLSITVTGANDAAVITGLASGTVKEDTAGQLTATGTLAATDVDSPATFNPASAAGTYGSFSIAANGTWTYTLSNAAANVQALREGDTRTETFTVTTADGTPRSIIVTVLGTNEIPTVANVLASGAEDPAAPIPVTLAGSDVDGTVTSLTLADLPANGTLYRDAAMTQPVTVGTPISATSGAVTLYFQPGANWNGSTSFHFTATDNNGGNSSQATASITVTPVADAAVLGSGSGSVKEDTPAQSTASGTLSIVDPDAGEAVFQAQTNVAGTYGSFSVNTAGAWTYTIDNTKPVVQALKEGETRTEAFTVRSADGTATTVSLTIVGTNDGPVANPNTATTPEDQPVTVNVLGNDTDPDGDTLTVTGATVDPAKGSVVVNANGTLTFNPAANTNGPVVVTYTIADGKGGTATSTVTINVTPVNDAPVAVNDSATTSEDSPVSRTAALGVLANDNDIDSTGLSVSGVRVGTSGAFAAPGASGITLTGTYGSLLIRADGSYTYTPGAAAQALNT